MGRTVSRAGHQKYLKYQVLVQKTTSRSKYLLASYQVPSFFNFYILNAIVQYLKPNNKNVQFTSILKLGIDFRSNFDYSDFSVENWFYFYNPE